MESHLIVVFISTVLVTAILEQGTHLELRGKMIPNNSVVDYNDITDTTDEGSDLRCVTERMDCCSFSNRTKAEWFTPNGSPAIHNQWSIYWNKAGYISMYRSESTTLQEGLYYCNIIAVNGDISTLYVGIYTSNNSGRPTISGITLHRLSPEVFTLTCTSTGGPATTVTWILNCSVITYDANHVLTQTVVNTTTAEYNNTLTVTGREPGNYQCTVSNAIGNTTSQKLLVMNNNTVINTILGETELIPPSCPSSLMMVQMLTTPKPSTTTTPGSQSTPSADPSPSSQLPVAIAGAAVGLILCIILIVVLILTLTVYKRRKGTWPWGKKTQGQYSLQQNDDTSSSVSQNPSTGQTLIAQPPVTMEFIDPSYSLLTYNESDQKKKKKSTGMIDSFSTNQKNKQTSKSTAEDEPKPSSGPGYIYAVVDKSKKVKCSAQSESRADPITMETVGSAETGDVYAVVQKKVKKEDRPPPLPASYQEKL